MNELEGCQAVRQCCLPLSSGKHLRSVSLRTKEDAQIELPRNPIAAAARCNLLGVHNALLGKGAAASVSWFIIPSSVQVGFCTNPGFSKVGNKKPGVARALALARPISYPAF